MKTVTDSKAILEPNGHQFDQVCVRDHENNEHVFSVSEAIEFIGGGTRGGVSSVLEEKRGLMVVKQYPPKRIYEGSGGADCAMSGQKTLLQILPSEEHELVVQPLYVDSTNQRLFAPLLNKDQWVVGTARNSSKDRDALKENKLPDVQNFDRLVARLFDALEHVGQNGSALCADVYFLTINHISREIGYLYGDFEAIHDERVPAHPNHIAPSNLVGAATSLHSFLHECVKNPEIYLKSLYTETSRRLNTYKGVDPDIDETIAILEEKKWPEPTVREMVKKALSWVRKWLKERWETLKTD